MRVVELASAKRLLCFVDKFQQLQSSVHIGGRLGNFDSYGFDCVAWLEAQQVSVALPLVKLVGIRTLNVLDQLQFETFSIGQLADCSGNGLALGKLRGTIAPCAKDELISTCLPVCERSHENWLKDAVLFDVIREFCEFLFVKLSARVFL